MSFDMYYGYALSVNPAQAYAATYLSMMQEQLSKQVKRIEIESQKDDYERGYDALLKGDIEKAIRCWEKESLQGVTQASKALGDLYHFRLKKLDKALHFYHKALDAGDYESGALAIAAKLHLGDLSENELQNVDPKVQIEPWFKYVQASLASTPIARLEDYSDEELDNLLTGLHDAVDYGVPFAAHLMGDLLSYVEHERAIEYWELAASMGIQVSVQRILVHLCQQGQVNEAAEFIIKWESQFEWDLETAYLFITPLRIYFYLPGEKRGSVKVLDGFIAGLSRINSVTDELFGSTSHNGLRPPINDWDLFQEEIRRKEHGQTENEFGWYLQQNLQEVGKNRQSLVLLFVRRLMREYIITFPDGIQSARLYPISAIIERVLDGYSGKDLSGLIFYKQVLQAMHTDNLSEILSELERKEIVGQAFYDDSSILMTDLDFLKRLLKDKS
jgi:tetratricopeptide (TPR) repeat protein